MFGIDDLAVLGVAAGAQIIGGIIQYYNSEKQRGADEETLRKIEAMFDAIKPPNYDLSVNDPPKLHEQALASPQFAEAKFNMSALKSVGKLVPELAPLIAEEAPKLLQQTEGQKVGREAQLKALSRLQQIGAGETDPEFQQLQQEAARRAQGEAQSRQDSILQDYARRGQSNSGLSLAAQLQGGASSINRASEQAGNAATQAYRNRIDALLKGAELGGRIGEEDLDIQSRNLNTINSFNQRMAANRQGYENQRAGTLNAANEFNLRNEQGIENANRQREDAMEEARLRRSDDITRNRYDAARSERNYANDLAFKKYGIGVDEKNRQNELRRQMFQDEYNITAGRAGRATLANENSRANRLDQNNSIQGISNIISNTGSAYLYHKNKDKKDDSSKQDSSSQDSSAPSSSNLFGNLGNTYRLGAKSTYKPYGTP